jgi:hypothetical protein
MRDDAERYYATHSGITTLFLGLLLPPAAWLAHLSASFTLTEHLCSSSQFWLLHLVTLVTFVIAAVGGLLAWRNWRDTGRAHSPDAAGTIARSNFLAVAGMASGVFFSIAILAAELPNWMISPCA